MDGKTNLRVLISILEWKASFRSGRERCVNNLLIFTDPPISPHRTLPPLFPYTDLTLINSPSKIPELWTSAKSQNPQVFTSNLNSNEFLASWPPRRRLGLSGDHSSGHGRPHEQRRGTLLLSPQPRRRFPRGGVLTLCGRRAPLTSLACPHPRGACLRPLDPCPGRAIRSAVTVFARRRRWCFHLAASGLLLPWFSRWGPLTSSTSPGDCCKGTLGEPHSRLASPEIDPLRAWWRMSGWERGG